MAHSGNILFLGGDDAQRKAIQTALKQACTGHELWDLVEEVEGVKQTLSFNGTRVYSFAFRPLPEDVDACRKAVNGSDVVFLVCMVEASGEPSHAVTQALEALRQDSTAPAVYPLLLIGAELTQMERTLLWWGWVGLSLEAPEEAPYGMNALLARCLPWMEMGEAHAALTVAEVETFWGDYCRYGTLKALNRLTLRLKDEGILAPLDYAWFLPQGTRTVLPEDVRADLTKLVSLLPKSGCSALTVAARKQYIARIDRLELKTFQVREWRTAFTMALKAAKFEKEKPALPARGEGQSASTTAPSSAKEDAVAGSFLFSFEGRMSPRAWFGASLLLGLLGVPVIAILAVTSEEERFVLLITFGIPLGIAWIWGICATSVRRLHDMGAPGALILPGVIALVASLIEMVVMIRAAAGGMVVIEDNVIEGSDWSRIVNLILSIAIFVVMIMPGDPKENKYGAPTV